MESAIDDAISACQNPVGRGALSLSAPTRSVSMGCTMCVLDTVVRWSDGISCRPYVNPHDTVPPTASSAHTTISFNAVRVRDRGFIYGGIAGSWSRPWRWWGCRRVDEEKVRAAFRVFRLATSRGGFTSRGREAAELSVKDRRQTGDWAHASNGDVSGEVVTMQGQGTGKA